MRRRSITLVLGLLAALALGAALRAEATTPCTLTLTQPATNAFIGGNNYLVKWTASGCSVDTVKVEWTKGGSSGVIGQPAVTAGQQAWNTTSLTQAGGYKVTITAINSNGVTVEDSKFGSGITIDNTAPSITFASRIPAANANGWNNSNVTATWNCADTNGVQSASVSTTVSSEGQNQSATGTCTDVAGNTASNSVTGISIDKTAPSITGSRAPAANGLGWNNVDVTASWSCSDPLSGLASTAADQVVSGEGAGQSRTGTCVDRAGNSASSTVSDISIDKTAPSATATADHAPNFNGWYNTGTLTVSYAGSDAMSGIASCSAPASYSGPDTASGSLGGQCSDKAGNSGTAPFSFQYDATAPSIALTSRVPAANGAGWNNAPVNIAWSCSDATSGAVAATDSASTSTDGAGQALIGHCSDNAGNSTSNTQLVSLDQVAPTATVAASRAADNNGWYTAPFGISWSGNDALSGIASCTAPVTYSGPETAADSRSGTCTDVAGNTSTADSLAFKYDTNDPTITLISRTPANGAGWNNASVSLEWSCTDSPSGVVAPTIDATVSAEGSAQSSTGTCEDNAGHSASNTVSGINIDLTAPSLSVAASRGADHNGWYTHSFDINWTGTDSLSGIASCPANETYTGPDTTSDSRSGTCTDNAGNTSNTAALDFKYDATNPTITLVSRTPANGAGWNNAAVSVEWSCTDATAGAVAPSITKTVNGEGAAQSSTGTCEDNAGNTADNTVNDINIDLTAPSLSVAASRGADHDGWYTHSFDFNWSGTDTLSGIATCPADETYTGPDTTSDSRSGTCTDNAGNTSNTATLDFKYDATNPTITLLSRTPANTAGWNNSAVEVDWSCTDTTAGAVDATITHNLASEGAGQSSTGTCEDNAGNTADNTVSGINIDLTAPTLDIAASRGADHDGWYTHSFDINWTGTDSLSGIATCPADETYTGPDTTSDSRNGTCTDNAGNTSNTATLDFKYDATNPTITLLSRTPANTAGWNNSAVEIDWSCTDTTAGAVDPTITHNLASEGAAQSSTGTCTDNAGNTASNTVSGINIDLTAPTADASASRAADHDGWYTHSFDINWTGTDSLSGIASCSGSVTISSDTTDDSRDGICTDNAGNESSAASLSYKYDGTAPTIALTLRTAANGAGWNNTPVQLAWSCSDATSGPVDPVVSSMLDSEGAAQSTTGTCADHAGNTVDNTVSDINIDLTKPAAHATASRAADHNDWYNASFDISWSGSDAVSGVASCSDAATYGGPDTAGDSRSGTCTDVAGNESEPATLEFRYDATAPSVTGTADHAPNAAGWYNSAVAVTWSGIDQTSGLDACDAPSGYNGPDSGSASVTGNCTDQAGNARAASYALKYDATPATTTVDLPALPLVAGPLGGFVTGTAADATSGVDATRVTFTDALGHATTVDATCSTGCGTNATTWSAPVDGLVPGIYTVTAASSDIASNAGTVSAPIVIVIVATPSVPSSAAPHAATPRLAPNTPAAPGAPASEPSSLRNLERM